MLPLFDEPPEFDRDAVAARLRELAAEQIYIGCSSWKYEGWIGQVYTNERYMTRGRYSRKKFEQACLSEYAETFPIVCGDFSFYQFPPDEFWRKLFACAPEPLKFAFKVPEEITVKRFPTHPRYGPRAGLDNPTYLNADMFGACFLRPLEAYAARLAVLIFEFGTFSKAAYPEPEMFFAELERFLAVLPRGAFQYAVEVRNEEYLRPGYYSMLARQRAAHVFNGWTRMPPIHVQIANEEAFTAPFLVSRALLRAGRTYENAVAMFAPYHRIQDPNPNARAGLQELIERAKQRHIPAYLFINNRLEGNAPMTIQAIVEESD